MRSNSFAGQVSFRPGGTVRVSVGSLGNVGLSATGIVALLGEADEGEPGSSAGVVQFDDPVDLINYFGTGALADAGKLAFNPSGDLRIPGGAVRVLAYKTNASTKAASSLRSAYGLATSTIAAGSSISSVKWTGGGLPTGTTLKDFWVRVTLTGGALEYRAITSVESDGETMNVSPSFSAATTGNAVSILHKEFDIQSAVYGSSGNDISFLLDTGGGDEFEITDGVNTESFTVSGLDAAHKNIFHMMYTGGAVADGGTAFGLCTAASTSVVTVDLGGSVTAAQLAGKVLDMPSLGLRRLIASHTDGSGSDIEAFTLSSGHEITAAQAASLVGELVYVRDITTATATIFGKAGSAYGIVTYVNSAENYKYKFLTSPTTQTLSGFKSVAEAGTYQVTVTSGVSGDLVTMSSLDFAKHDSLTAGVLGKNANIDIRFDSGITSPSMFGRLSYGFASKAASVITLGTVSRATSEVNIAAQSPSTTTGSTTSTIEYAGATFSGADVHKGKWLVIAGETVYITSNTTTALKVFPALSAAPGNAVSGVIYNYGNGGTDFATVTQTYLTGGARGISSNNTFEAGFDALLLQRHNHIVPLIDQDLTNEGNGSTATWASVSANLVEHVADARTGGNNECGGYIGYKASKTNLLAAVPDLNDADVQLTGQALEVLDASNEVTVLPYWSSAVSAAGMRAGAIEVGEPLTYKYVKTKSITQDSTWNPSNKTDANALIEKGVLFIEETPQGFRWVRDMTTYLQGDETAFIEGSTRDAVRFMAYDLRSSVESKFTGIKGTLSSITAVKEFAIDKFRAYKEQNVIVESEDENGTLNVRGWRNLRISLSGKVLTLRVELYPCQSLTWQNIDIVLQDVSLSASA